MQLDVWGLFCLGNISFAASQHAGILVHVLSVRME